SKAGRRQTSSGTPRQRPAESSAVGALDAVEWEVCSLEPVRNPAAERMLRSTFGAVPPSARYFLDCRWVTGAYAALATLPVHQLSPDLTEMIARSGGPDPKSTRLNSSH